MEQTKSIFNFNMDIVTGNLYNAVMSLSKGKEFIPLMGVKKVYFVGRTLCMDYNDDVLTLCHRDEDIGYFSGGFRRLLSIENMKLFEALMDLCEIGHNQKWVVTKRFVNS
jgi:hypothetical protein